MGNVIVRFGFKMGDLAIKLFNSCSSQLQNSSKPACAKVEEGRKLEGGSYLSFGFGGGMCVLYSQISLHKGTSRGTGWWVFYPGNSVVKCTIAN